MEKYTIYVKDDCIEIQKFDYIEHGFIIRIEGEVILLLEIPYRGGEEVLIGYFKTLQEAIHYSKTLN